MSISITVTELPSRLKLWAISRPIGPAPRTTNRSGFSLSEIIGKNAICCLNDSSHVVFDDEVIESMNKLKKC